MRTVLALALALSPLACLNVPDGLDEPGGPAGAPSTANELLERHVRASGGEEALRALSQRTVEARVVFLPEAGCEEGSNDCVWEERVGQFVLYTTADGRMYRRMVLGDDMLEYGFDGSTGWQMQADPQVLVLEDPAAVPVLREDALLHWYLDLDTREELALELLSPRTVGEDARELDGVRWFAAGPTTPETEKWFDRATGLLYEELERDTENGDVIRRVHSDYRDVDGVQVPWLITQITSVEGRADQIVELRMQVVHHREVRDELFAVPEVSKPEPEPDQLLAALEQARVEAEANPKEIEAQVMHARLAFAAAHFDEARKVAGTVLALDKGEFEAQFILARIAMLEGDEAQALTRLRRALKGGLREDEAARQLALIHMRSGDWKRAANDLEIAGQTELAARYAAFDGKPLTASLQGGGCETRVPIRTVEGAIVAEVAADGETLELLLDTGASDLIISDVQARSLVIGTDAEAPLAIGGPALPQGQLDGLTLGQLRVANVPVTMIPEQQLGMFVGLEGVDGVLGVRPFAGRQLSVDVAAGELLLVEPGRRCAAKREAQREGVAVPLWLHETHYLYVRGQMNGAEGIYLLNTGMRGADMTANEGAYGHAAVPRPAVRAGQATLAVVERFSLGEFQRIGLRAAWGFLTQNASSDGFRIDGMIGATVLGPSWTIDFAEQRLYLRAGEAPQPPDGATKVPGGVPGGVPAAPANTPNTGDAPSSTASSTGG